MSKIAKPFYEFSDAMGFPLFALILFIVVFSIVAIRAALLNKDELSKRAQMVFDDPSEAGDER